MGDVTYQGVSGAHGRQVLVVGKGPIYYLGPDGGEAEGAWTVYAWGAQSRASRSLARALLVNYCGLPVTEPYVRAFADEVLAELPAERWEITGREIDQWLLVERAWLSEQPATASVSTLDTAPPLPLGGPPGPAPDAPEGYVLLGPWGWWCDCYWWVVARPEDKAAVLRAWQTYPWHLAAADPIGPIQSAGGVFCGQRGEKL